MQQDQGLGAELQPGGRGQGGSTADLANLEAWLQQHYLHSLTDGQDVTRDQGRTGSQGFHVLKSAKLERHELQMLCAQLHFNWHNERAKLQEMRGALASLVLKHRQLQQELVGMAACKHGCCAANSPQQPQQVSCRVCHGSLSCFCFLSAAEC